jgi:hypothetical protein
MLIPLISLLSVAAAMNPIPITKLQTMHDDMIAMHKLEIAKPIVTNIYSFVKNTATIGKETKYVHIIEQHTFKSHGEKTITIDDIKDHILSELKRLFPGCNVIYVERKPDADIFSVSYEYDPRRPDRKSDKVKRAFVVDWS